MTGRRVAGTNWKQLVPTTGGGAASADLGFHEGSFGTFGYHHHLYGLNGEGSCGLKLKGVGEKNAQGLHQY